MLREYACVYVCMCVYLFHGAVMEFKGQLKVVGSLFSLYFSHVGPVYQSQVVRFINKHPYLMSQVH